MTDTRYLVHGVFWDGQPAPGQEYDGGSPVLRLQPPSGAFREVSLHPGARLGFQVASGGRFCLGHHKVHSESRRDHVLCPAAAPAAKGKQCERCFVLDDSRLIHDFHRGGRVPAGLRTYLMQQHWLYVATFAGGASKVGTASHLRKWNRLAEQGAVVARYVARAQDGRVVRILEDMVTREAGLTQQVRSAAKEEALVQPLPDPGWMPSTPATRPRSVRCWRAPPSNISALWTNSGCGRRRQPGSANPRRGTPTRTRSTAAGTALASRPSAGPTPWHGWTERTPPLW